MATSRKDLLSSDPSKKNDAPSQNTAYTTQSSDQFIQSCIVWNKEENQETIPEGHIDLKHFELVKTLEKKSLHSTELWKMKADVYDFSVNPPQIYHPEYIIKRSDNLLHLQIEAAHAELKSAILPEYSPKESFIVRDEKNIYGLAIRKLPVFSPLSENDWNLESLKNDPDIIPFLGSIFSFAYLAGEDDLNKEQFDIIHKKWLDPDMQAWPITRHFKGDRLGERRDMQNAFELNLSDFLNLPFYEKANPQYSPHNPTRAEIRNTASVIYNKNWANKQYTYRDQEIFTSIYQEPNFEYAKFHILLRFILLDEKMIRSIYTKHISPQATIKIEGSERSVVELFVKFYIQHIELAKKIFLENTNFLRFANDNYGSLCKKFENYKENTKNLSKLHFREYGNTQICEHTFPIYLKKADEQFKNLFVSHIKNHKKLDSLDKEIDFFLQDEFLENHLPTETKINPQANLIDSDDYEEYSGENSSGTTYNPPPSAKILLQPSASIPIKTTASPILSIVQEVKDTSSTSSSMGSPSPSPKSPGGLLSYFWWSQQGSSSSASSSPKSTRHASSADSISTSQGNGNSNSQGKSNFGNQVAPSINANQSTPPSTQKKSGWFS